jgi:antitoxin component YwqK of YwqJK toxin-antitoxin module
MKRLLLIILPLLLIVGCSGFQFNHVSIGWTFKDSIKKGVYTFRYENGQKQYEGTFKDGKEDGLHTWWYRNGQKKFERTYKDGEIVKLIGKWSIDGSVKE